MPHSGFQARYVYLAMGLLISLSVVAAVPVSQNLPLTFEENRGQAPARVRYVTRMPGYWLDLMENGVELHLTSGVLRIQFVGGNHRAAPRGYARIDELIRYVGTDPSKGINNKVRSFASVRYESLYPGIDLVFYGRRGQLQYDLFVAPGSEPEDIHLEVEGADRLDVDDAGDLLLQTADVTLRMRRPGAFQMDGRNKREVDVRYEISDSGNVTLALDNYDSNLPLMVHPR